jgi:hypothetical protein
MSTHIKPEATVRTLKMTATAASAPAPTGDGPQSWTRRKRDPLPRGIFVHAASAPKAVIYGIRYTCGLGHIHQEKAGPLKSDATRRYHERRGRMRDEPRWCPRVERREAQEHAQAEAERRRGKIPFRRYADDYLAWSKTIHRSQRTAAYEVRRLVGVLGDAAIDSVTRGMSSGVCARSPMGWQPPASIVSAIACPACSSERSGSGCSSGTR